MTTPPEEVSWNIERDYWGYDPGLPDDQKNALVGIGMAPFDGSRHAGIVSNYDKYDNVVVLYYTFGATNRVISKNAQYKYIATSGTTDYITQTLNSVPAAAAAPPPIPPASGASAAGSVVPPMMPSAGAAFPPPPTTAAAAPLITYDTLTADDKRKVDEYVNSSMRRFPNSDRDALRQRTAQRYFGSL